LNVFSHCLPHSAELMRFSAFQFTNEASGHVNREHAAPVHAVEGGWAGCVAVRGCLGRHRPNVM
jgi:hypothetical protein